MEDIVLLAIESSCDETACAIVRNGHEILSNVVAIQNCSKCLPMRSQKSKFSLSLILTILRRSPLHP